MPMRLMQSSTDQMIKEEADKQRQNDALKAAILKTQPPSKATGDLYFQQKRNMLSMKKLDAQIDDIKFEPKSAMEYRNAKKEEERQQKILESGKAKKQEELLSESEGQFRLKQKPEFQSTLLQERQGKAKAQEREKLKQLQKEFENPFFDKRESQFTLVEQSAPKPTPAQQYLSDLATNDAISQQNNYKSAFQDLRDAEIQSKFQNTNKNTTKRDTTTHQPGETVEDGVTADNPFSQYGVTRVDPNNFRPFLSNQGSNAELDKLSRTDQENKEGGSYSKRDRLSPAKQAPGSSRASRRAESGVLGQVGQAIASPGRGPQLGKYNSNEDTSQAHRSPNNKAGAGAQKDLSPSRYRQQVGQMGPSGEVELANVGKQGSPRAKNQAGSGGKDDQAVREQIEQIVRKQLAAQETQDRLIGKKAANVGPLGPGELEQLKKQMSMTDGNFNFNVTHLNQDSDGWDGVQNARGASFKKAGDDAKSVRSTRTGKTMFTTKTRYATNGVKVVSTSNLAPVGMNRLQVPTPAAATQATKQNRYNTMLRSVLGTENLIEKILEIFEVQEDQVDWPADAEPNPKIQQKLSYTKMLNEINHLEPRGYTAAGQVEPYPVWRSKTGWHSSNKRWRRSELEQLGIGINLYFKMLKYFSILFLLFFVLSIPSMLIYGSGEAHANHRISYQQWLNYISLGNMDPQTRLMPATATVIQTYNLVSYLPMKCPGKSTLSDLLNFGLAHKQQTFIGQGPELRINTTKACSYGSMSDLRAEWDLEQAFNTYCRGNRVCSLPLDFTQVFSKDCQAELLNRLAGNETEGPPKIQALFLCSQDKVIVSGDWALTREQASILVVSLDLAIILIFAISIFRLRYYEKLTVNDIKHGGLWIDDFSVYISGIPVESEDYQNNPELLKAMIATHLENILQNELQVIAEMEESQVNQCEIASIHFGLTSQNIMRHLVNIFKEVKQIQQLKKKMKNDPQNQSKYEKQIWKHYNAVTSHKDAYFKDKMGMVPTVANCYITFRSMEGKQRALVAYDTKNMKRIFAEYICCMSSIFKRKKLLQKGYYDIGDTVDPECIIWENLGTSRSSKVLRWVGAGIVCLLLCAISFYGVLQVSNHEKDYVKYMKSDCSGEASYSQDLALADLQVPQQEQSGVLNCYCRQMLTQFGKSGMKVLFADGEKHCEAWYPVYYLESYTTLILALWLSFMNLVTQIVINWLAAFRRPKNIIDGHKQTTTQIFLAQYINTAILFMLTYHSFLQSTAKRLENSKDDIFTGPYDEFNVRWYLVIGSALGYTIIFQIFTPHIPMLLSYLWKSCLRFYDRRFSFNDRVTRQVVQSDYEMLYTGPEFILQVRFAQFLCTIFVTMTYSSGLPVLYAIGFVSMVCTYWIDKLLLLRFYRLTDGYSQHLSSRIVKLTPLAILVHSIFGYMIFSYPYILSSPEISFIGNQSQYFNSNRMGQIHMVVFVIGFLIVWVILFFEKSIIFILSRISQLWAKKPRKRSYIAQNLPDPQETPGNLKFGHTPGRPGTPTQSMIAEKVGPPQFVYADDIYQELNFKQLYNEYKKLKQEKQRLLAQKSKSRFTPLQLKKYVDDYIKIVERNEAAVYRRLRSLTDTHIEAIHEVDPDIMTENEKIKTVLEYYHQATDKNNPLRDHIELEAGMHGSLLSKIQSYDLMDNQKYKDIDQLLEVMCETFGFNEDLTDLVKNSISQPKILKDKSYEQRRLIDPNMTNQDLFNATIRSNDIEQNDNESQDFLVGSVHQHDNQSDHTKIN